MSGIAVDSISANSGTVVDVADDMTAGNATFSGIVKADDIQETTVGHGVEIDGALLKDGGSVGSLEAEAGDTVDVSAASLVLADDPFQVIRLKAVQLTQSQSTQ